MNAISLGVSLFLCGKFSAWEKNSHVWNSETPVVVSVCILFWNTGKSETHREFAQGVHAK